LLEIILRTLFLVLKIGAQKIFFQFLDERCVAEKYFQFFVFFPLR
jgi:hypothetical protein